VAKLYGAQLVRVWFEGAGVQRCRKVSRKVSSKISSKISSNISKQSSDDVAGEGVTAGQGVLRGQV
jgi:hypothetical protein